MRRRILSTVLAAFIVDFVCYGQTGTGVTQKDIEEADKIFATVFRIGVGTQTVVKVDLKDGTEFKGYIREINDENFVIVQPETNISHTLTYLQVKKVTRYKSRRWKVGNVAGYVAFFGVIGVWTVLQVRK